MDHKGTVKTPSQIYFELELEKARTAEQAAQAAFNGLAVGRLVAFLSIFGIAWVWSQTNQPAWAVGVFIALVLFLILMRRQQTARRLRDFQRNLQTVNEDELARLDFRFKRSDNGVQFQEKSHPFAADLDVFGDYSLYRLLNRTRTSEGSTRLADWLKAPAIPEEIKLRQQASSEIKSHPGFIQEWEATALLHEHAAKQVGAFRSWSEETLSHSLKRLMPWRWWSAVTGVILILILAGYLPAWVLVLSLAVHLVVLKQFLGTIQSVTNRTASLGLTLVAYSDLLKNAEKAPFKSEWWRQRQSLINHSAHALEQAGRLFEKLDYRNNPFFSIFIGIPTFWDVHCLAGLEKWKANYHSQLENWLDVLADVEAMNSLSGHAFANNSYILPAVSRQDGVHIETLLMGHPLIPAQKRISNSFQIKGTGHTILVTGSNMSGKSTFLRTIGLNLVLAQIGAVVSADKFNCSPVRVFSSMRTQDSLEESTSSFYAELKRLRTLLELADEHEKAPVFYLLDEILKGTNSADRHRGAEALIRQLHTKNASGLVSTHDLELGEWGSAENYVHNFHFRSDVEKGRLHFDYQLHEGICRSFNASELMRMMGIEIDIAT